MKVAIIGATGHVGRALTHYFRLYGHSVTAFGRTGGRGIAPLSLFPGEIPDILINCIGVGTPQEEKSVADTLYDIENEWDDKCLEVVRRYPTTTYIYFSSGVASLRFDCRSHYSATKRMMEAKHRGLSRVYDVRLYSFFTRFINLDNGQLLPSIISATKSREVFKTTRHNLWRSYISPGDLMVLIYDLWERQPAENVVEAVSGPPVSKDRILNWFASTYDLKIERVAGPEDPKPYYFPETVNYQFKDSFDTIREEAYYFLGGRPNI